MTTASARSLPPHLLTFLEPEPPMTPADPAAAADSAHPKVQLLDPADAAADPGAAITYLTTTPDPADAADPDRARRLLVLSDGREFHAPTVAAETRMHLETAATALWEACRRVAWAREVMSRGDWLTWCDSEVGMGKATAYRFLKAAKALAPLGGPSPKMLAHGKSAMLDLTSVLDAEELEALERGEEVEGLGDHDDISAMSRRQLTKALKAKRQTAKGLEDTNKRLTRELEAAQRKVGKLVSGQGDASAELARMKALRPDVDLVFAKIRTLVGQIDWPAASPQLQAETAGLAAAIQQQLIMLQADLGAVCGLSLHDLIPGGAAAAAVGGPDALALELANALEPGVVFTTAELAAGTLEGGSTWPVAVALDALEQLHARGVISREDATSWRWNGAEALAQDVIPSWLQDDDGDAPDASDAPDNVTPIHRS